MSLAEHPYKIWKITVLPVAGALSPISLLLFFIIFMFVFVFFQFHRVANLHFIFIVLLNWFPAINAFGKEISMIPVLFVLGVTAIKDMFEDRRRHLSDKRINNLTCRIYDG